MTPAELEHSRQSMQQRWYELVQAEQRGVSSQELERMYDLYLHAVEQHNRSTEAYQLAHQEPDAEVSESSQAFVSHPAAPAKATSSTQGGRKRKAS
jgi:hypothetical protein